MRKLAVLGTAVVLGVSTAAVGYAAKGSANEAMTADIERDLELAAATPAARTRVVSALEQGRNGAPSGQSRGARMVVPTKQRAPSAAASRQVMDAPVEHEHAEAPAPSPSSTPSDPVAIASSTGESSTDAAPPDLSYPTPAEAPATGAGRAQGTGNDGRGVGRTGMGVAGAVLGAILRGSSVGHDKCIPQGTRRPRVPIIVPY